MTYDQEQWSAQVPASVTVSPSVTAFSASPTRHDVDTTGNPCGQRDVASLLSWKPPPITRKNIREIDYQTAVSADQPKSAELGQFWMSLSGGIRGIADIPSNGRSSKPRETALASRNCPPYEHPRSRRWPSSGSGKARSAASCKTLWWPCRKRSPMNAASTAKAIPATPIGPVTACAWRPRM